MNYSLQLKLHSDTTFGRGDGVAGLVDVEVEHEESGLPFLRGRALKGMLVYECADILFALKQSGKDMTSWINAARFLFGESGGTLEGEAQLEVGNAYLPANLRQTLAYQMQNSPDDAGQLRHEVLNGLTTIRRQTAVEADGVAKDSSLRVIRLIRRDTIFEASLNFSTMPDDHAKGLLAACVKAWRRAGTRRNRGTGLVEATLFDTAKTEITESWFNEFNQKVSP